MRRIRIVRSYLVASWPVEAVAIGASSRVEYCGLCLTVGGGREESPGRPWGGSIVDVVLPGPRYPWM